MFLKKYGKSGRFTFDIINSALQKSLRRGDEKLSIEMGYEFIEYPNALKKQLIQNCTEDCPDLNLIWDIYNTKPLMPLLMAWIPVICKHVKCRDGIYGMRVACEMDFLFDPPKLTNLPYTSPTSTHSSIMTYKVLGNNELNNNNDDLLTLLRKCFTYMCNEKVDEFISYFQPLYPNIKLKYIYNFINKHPTFLYTLCVYSTINYIHETYYLGLFKMDNNKEWDKNLQLPEYVYDRNVLTSPKQNKTYEFFINNCVISPRYKNEESFLEQEGKKLYIKTNKDVSSMIRPIIECETLNSNNVKLIQVQLIYATYKPRVYFCSINNGKIFDYVLKGPFNKKEDMDPQLLSDVIKNELLTIAPYDSKIVSYNREIYIMSLNLIPVEKDNVVIKNSKLESNVTIYNGDRYIFNNNLDKLTKNEKENLLEILAYRKIIGTNDTCNRNIIYYNNLFYTIDDPILLTQTNYIFNKPLNDKLSEKYKRILYENFAYMKNILKSWDKIIYYSDLIPDNVKIFMRLRIVELLHKNNWVF